MIDHWLRSHQPAVIFDFNGTLSDDEPILFDIFSELFRAHLNWEMTPEDYRDELLGRSDREIIEHAVNRHGRGTKDEVADLLRLRQGVYKQRVADENPIADATVELVKLLADNNIPIGIVTGAQRDDVLAVLREQCGRRVVQRADRRRGRPQRQAAPRGISHRRRAAEPRGPPMCWSSKTPYRASAPHWPPGMHCIAVAGRQPDPQLHAVAPAIVAELSPGLVGDALTNWRRAPGFPRRPAT